MLSGLRTWGSSWSAKIILGTLAASMGVFWGMGDFFSGSGSLTVATVGDVRIRAQDFRAHLERYVRRAQNQIGRSLTLEEIKNARLPRVILAEMIQETLMDLEVTRLGLTVSDEAVRKAVLANPAFHNDKKEFSREKFESVLSALGLYEKVFLDLLKKEMCRSQLVNALRGLVPSPETIASLWASAQTQKRYGGMVVVAANALPADQKPTQKELVTFYEQEKERFRIAEKRGFSLGVLDVRQIEKGIQVPESDVQKSLAQKGGPSSDGAQAEALASLLRKKARVQAHELAQQMEDDLASGASLKDVSQKYGVTFQEVPPSAPSEIQLKGGDRLQEDVRRKIFELKQEGETSVERFNDGTYAVLRLNKILPSRIPPLSEIPELVQQVCAREKKVEKAFELAQQKLTNLRLGKIADKTLKALPAVSLGKKDAPVGVPPEVQTALLELSPGASRLVQSAKRGEAYVVKLFRVEDRKQKPTAKLTDDVHQMLQEDVIQAYVGARQSIVHIKINKEALAAVVG